jgi:hypothetical protein
MKMEIESRRMAMAMTTVIVHANEWRMSMANANDPDQKPRMVGQQACDPM